MAYFHDTITFADPAGLSAIAARFLVDEMFYAVSNRGDGFPAFYQYRAAGAEALDANVIIDCTNGSGQFKMFGAGGGGGGGLQGIGSGRPSGSVSPDSVNSLYLQRVTSDPSREVLWVATGTSNTSWVVAQASSIRGDGYGSPDDYVIADQAGQYFIDIDTSSGYIDTFIATAADDTQWVSCDSLSFSVGGY